MENKMRTMRSGVIQKAKEHLGDMYDLVAHTPNYLKKQMRFLAAEEYYEVGLHSPPSISKLY